MLNAIKNFLAKAASSIIFWVVMFWMAVGGFLLFGWVAVMIVAALAAPVLLLLSIPLIIFGIPLAILGWLVMCLFNLFFP